METIKDKSLKIKNFKCFGSEPAGFDDFLPMNVIIGKNNSGKSSLLDFIEYLTKNWIQGGKDYIPDNLWHQGNEPEVILKCVTENTHVERGGVGTAFSGFPIKIKIRSDNQNSKVLKFEHSVRNSLSETQKDNLANQFENPLKAYYFKKINVDRNISPEVEGKSKNSTPRNDFDESGVGATDIIHRFINDAQLPNELVEERLLYSLNEIFSGETKYERIVSQYLEQGGDWEIFLDEDNKERLPLSQSGNGLKTVILILTSIYLIPKIQNRSIDKFVYCFEEVENNLHPSLLRRLLAFLYDFALENNTHFFLTTHSSVLIDFFSTKDQAQIIHTKHRGDHAITETINSYIGEKNILDELEFRASDILQTNAVIWVEGPTDRIYLKKWIDLWSDGKLKEGQHYQCIFYGGRLLSHLTLRDPTDKEIEEWIKLLRMNRNSIVVMDSDRNHRNSTYNETKKRIREEADEIDGHAWLTKLREIENYIPKNVINNVFEEEVDRGNDGYELFWDYLGEYDEEYMKFSNKKVEFAHKITEGFARKDLNQDNDLPEELDTICDLLFKWNDIVKD